MIQVRMIEIVVAAADIETLPINILVVVAIKEVVVDRMAQIIVHAKTLDTSPAKIQDTIQQVVVTVAQTLAMAPQIHAMDHLIRVMVDKIRLTARQIHVQRV